MHDLASRLFPICRSLPESNHPVKAQFSWSDLGAVRKSAFIHLSFYGFGLIPINSLLSGNFADAHSTRLFS